MPIFALAAAWLGKHFADTALRYIAIKVLLITLITVTLPVVLQNLFSWLYDQINLIMQHAQSTIGVEYTGSILTLSGMAGYYADHLQLSLCVSILITACIIRLTLNFIPFVG